MSNVCDRKDVVAVDEVEVPIHSTDDTSVARV